MIRGRGAKIDANQPAIVLELRRRGCSVQSLAEIGHGCPDIMVKPSGNVIRPGDDFASQFGQNEMYLFEIKDPTQPPSKRRLTDDEIRWHGNWCGPVYTIETAEQAWSIMVGA